MDLERYARYYNIPLKPKPRYYPQPPGCIELAGQIVIRLQQHYGIGSKEALAFSYGVQRCIWVTEEGDHCDLNVLKKIARNCGIAHEVVEKCCIDRRGNIADPGVQTWNEYHQEAVELGMSSRLSFPFQVDMKSICD